MPEGGLRRLPEPCAAVRPAVRGGAHSGGKDTDTPDGENGAVPEASCSRGLIAALGAFPIDRGGADIDRHQDRARLGSCRCRSSFIFPQGTRARRRGRSQKRARQCWRSRRGAPILPMYITRGRKRFRCQRHGRTSARPFDGRIREQKDYRSRSRMISCAAVYAPEGAGMSVTVAKTAGLLLRRAPCRRSWLEQQAKTNGAHLRAMAEIIHNMHDNRAAGATGCVHRVMRWRTCRTGPACSFARTVCRGRYIKCFKQKSCEIV